MLATSEVLGSSDSISPAPMVSEVHVKGRKLFIVRDDLLEGGTKQRAAIPYVNSCVLSGRHHFVYASPFSGFAQVALAHACQALNVACTLFCERDNSGGIHDFSLMAKSYGAKVILCSNLSEAHSRSLDFCFNDHRKMLIPLGFNDDLFRDILESELKRHWSKLWDSGRYSELWLPIGSGTLLGVFKKVVDPQTKIFAVNVNVLKESDERIRRIRTDPKVGYIRYKKEFHERSDVATPVPSNEYYDSKVFDIFKSEASDRALWWNVAR